MRLMPYFSFMYNRMWFDLLISDSQKHSPKPLHKTRIKFIDYDCLRLK